MPKRKRENVGRSTTLVRVRPKATTQIELERMLMHAEGKDTVEEAIEAHGFKIEGWKPWAKAAIAALGLRDDVDHQISDKYYKLWSRHADPQVVRSQLACSTRVALVAVRWLVELASARTGLVQYARLKTLPQSSAAAWTPAPSAGCRTEGSGSTTA
eukprot:COSAG06_NODE_5686_length_3320_cov_2.022043_1_plen_156_part_10